MNRITLSKLIQPLFETLYFIIDDQFTTAYYVDLDS